MSWPRALALGLVLTGSALGAWGASRAARTASLPHIDKNGVSSVESCLACHSDVEGLGSAHDPARIGCSSCHLGDPTRADERGAHEGMLVLTGGLTTVSSTCGRAECHTSEAGRVASSLMAGSPGILAVNRYAFGERERVEVRREDDMRALPARPKSPAEDHARKLCGSCHLGQDKEAKGDLGFASRGGGCAACHLTAPQGPRPATGRLHPGVGADVPERRCEGCHARSGRISLSFRGVAEVEPAAATRHLPDGRPVTDTTNDVHARAGMTCIDCHAERDVMGDGHDRPRHAREAVQVRCESCHDDEARGGEPDRDQRRVVTVLTTAWKARGMPSLEHRKPLTLKSGTPLWRTDEKTRTLLLSTNGQSVPLTAATDAAYHRLKGHERLSCQACHSEWAPRCVSCHTDRDASSKQLDHLTGEETPGEWKETAGESSFGAPALALDSRGRVAPFVEGMRLEVNGIVPGVSRELWAPLDPHTTGKSRSCASCHPGDAKTYPVRGDTTRTGARLLDEAERAAISRVGECIECHERYEDPIYVDFSKALPGPKCRYSRAESKPSK